MKSCFKCGLEKPLNCFYSHSRMKDGHLNKCKQCTRFDVKNNTSDYGLTEKGVIRVIYKTQKKSQRDRGFGDMPYSKPELATWLYANGFKHLFDEWSLSGNKKDLKPSVDRIDDFKGYSFDNIRLGTWLDNRKHQYSDIISGIGTGGKRCKPVRRINPETGCDRRYVSYWSAVRDVGYSLEYQLKKGIKCRNGFLWEYL